jgi:uncharacterized protein involved in outer membrane biogenesis
MALSRKAKVWLIVVSIPIILILGAAIALKLYFTPDRLKALAIPRIEEATHRSVTLNDISLSIFPSIGVDVDGFSLSNREGADFSPTPFLSLDRLSVRVNLMPLLSGNVEVTQVILEQPNLLIETNKAGVTNYSDLTQSATGESKGSSSGSGSIAGVLLSNFQIVNGSVDYIDYRQNSAMRVRGLGNTMTMKGGLDGVAIDGKASVADFSYGTVTVPLISGLRLTLDHRLVYSISQDVVTVEKGEMTVQDMPLKLAGKVSDLSKKVMVLDLTVNSDQLNITDLLSLVPVEYMKKAEGLKGNGTAKVMLAITGTSSDSTQPDVSGKISSTNASIQYARLPKPITNINIVSVFTRARTKQEFRLEKFSATLGDNPINMTMDLVNFENPSITMALNGSLNLAEVGQYYPLEPGTELSGRMSANVNVAGKVKEPAAMKASGTMEFQGVTIKTPASANPVRDLEGAVTFTNQQIEAKKISLNLGKSDLALAFALKNYLSIMSEDKSLPRPTATLTLNSNHLYTADVMGSEKSPPTAPAKDIAAAKKQQTGVPLPNIDMDINAAIGTLTMEKFQFTNVRGSMRIVEGVINMQNFSLNAFGGSAISKGSLNLRDPKRPLFDLTLDINGVESHDLLPHFTSFGQRVNGKMSMNTTMKGALNDTLGLVPTALNGQGRVQMVDGMLNGVKVNQTIASLLKLPDLETIRFKDWANSFTITDGRIIIKDLRIHALDADYTVNGSQGLDGSLDYTMTMLLSQATSGKVNLPGFAGQAAELFKDESGRLKLDFAVGGTTDDPKVQLDTKAAQAKAEAMAKQRLNDEAKKVEDQLKKKAAEVLNNLFKKKK